MSSIFFYTMPSIFFSTSSKTVSLRCSFCFHVDSNRATPHANTGSPLSASRGIRSIRIAITVPCQQHQQESLVMPLSCNCKKNAYLVVTMLSYTRYIFCKGSASKPILGNCAVYHIRDYSYRRSPLDQKLCGFTRNQQLTSVLCPNLQCVSELCPMAFRTFLMHPTVFSVETMQNDISIMLQKILLSIQALRVLPPPTFQDYVACVPRNTTGTPTRSTASSTLPWPR